MTMVDFEQGLSSTRTILIPFRSVEEHGTHLPLSTDTIQAYEVGKKASKGEGVPESPAFPDMLLIRNKRKYWPGGVWGDPTKATAEKGKMIEDHVVKRIVDLVKMMAEQTHLNK